MAKPRIAEVIVVEGRYDKNTLLQTVEATVVETGGFGVFRQKDKLALLRRLAERRGLILLTDSDGAGFVIRGFLRGALPRDKVKHAYIPDIAGKERRKRAPSRAGTLGVEGMTPQVLLEALRRCGATFLDGDAPREREAGPPITKADLFAAGLSGGAGSAARRQALLRELELPAGLTANGLLEVLNLLMDREAFLDLAGRLSAPGEFLQPQGAETGDGQQPGGEIGQFPGHGQVVPGVAPAGAPLQEEGQGAQPHGAAQAQRTQDQAPGGGAHM